ncbi:MAG: transcriptional regulator [Sphingomonas bacterium]|nr:transcriptional regulator [Sphingomonas bacterium]
MTDTEDEVETIMRGVMQLARRMRRSRAESAVPPAAVALLATLRRQGAMPAARLAEAEGLQPQSLSRLLATLEEGGLIEREPDPEDRRALVIRITQPGRQALRADMVMRYAWLAEAMAERLDADERLLLGKAALVMLRLADLPQSPADG